MDRGWRNFPECALIPLPDLPVHSHKEQTGRHGSHKLQKHLDSFRWPAKKSQYKQSAHLPTTHYHCFASAAGLANPRVGTLHALLLHYP